MVSDLAKYGAVDLMNRRIRGSAKANRARCYNREHLLKVCRQPRDRAQDLCGGGLLLPRVSKFAGQSCDLCICAYGMTPIARGL
jgi:hypothetical protein